MFTSLDKPWLPVSLDVRTGSDASLKASQSVKLSDKGRIEWSRTKVIFKKDMPPQFIEVFFSYNAEGKVDKISSKQGDMIFKY